MHHLIRTLVPAGTIQLLTAMSEIPLDLLESSKTL